MGCHTWFYHRVNRTQEEAKQSAIEYYKESIQLTEWYIYNEILNGTNPYNLTKESEIHRIEIAERCIRMIEKDLCQRAVWNKQSDDELNEYVNNKGFYKEGVRHDVIRVCKYPTVRFFSWKQMKKWLMNPKNKKKYCFNYRSSDKEWKELKQYWKQYPNSMVYFG